MFRDQRSTSSYSNPNAGAGYFVVLGAIGLAGWALWSFTTSILVPSLSLAAALAKEVLSGLPLGGLVDLGVDVLWGVAVGFFVGWLRWCRRKRSEAVEAIIEAVASREVVSATWLGWRYVLLHVGAGVLAGITVGLLGLAFPSQLLGSSTSMPEGIVWLRDAGLFGGGGGSDGGGEGEPMLLLIALLFLLLFVLPLLCGLVSGATAIGLKGVASGAAGAAGKIAGLALFLILTQLASQ